VTRLPRPADTSDMTRVSITGHPLTATAALVWHSNLPGPLQQILFDTADGASVAIGSPAVCLEWGTGLALAAGASEDEIADVLLAIAPVAGLGRVIAAAPQVATAPGYDIAVALEEPNDH
jgi:hypothetical protein